MDLKYIILDVFAAEKYAGNQLAVVITPEPIPDATMQAIAGEFHFSETTFVDPKALSGNEYRVRIFTPKSEVPFAGHPTLGTAYAIQNRIAEGFPKTIVLNMQAGRIPVRFESDGTIWMRQNDPVFGERFNAEEVAGIVGLNSGDVDSRFPVQCVSTGLEFLMLPIRSLEAVRKAATDLEAYRMFFRDREAKPIFLFCSETLEPENSIHCRMFADVFGIPEDPATGSANGCFSRIHCEISVLRERSSGGYGRTGF